MHLKHLTSVKINSLPGSRPNKKKVRELEKSINMGREQEPSIYVIKSWDISITLSLPMSALPFGG